MTATARRLEYVPLDDLKAAPRNPKNHSDAGIRASIDRHGFVEPVIVDERTGQLVGGHGRVDSLTAWRDAGDAPPEGITVDDDGRWLVPTVLGWASATDADAEALLVALNRLPEAGGWQADGLAELLTDLAATPSGLAGTGYNDDDLADLLAGLAATPPPDSPMPQPRPPAPVWTPDPPVTRLEPVTVRVIPGDCRETLRDLADATVDAIVTDPPYALDFMGKDWDSFDDAGERDAMRAFQNWSGQWAAEAFRILKPGGHLLAFGGTRTYHRLAVALEDAGFMVRDSLHWLYASGFPKSMDVGKATGDPAWAGWGTGLKPAHEPIVLARKPFDGTVAANVHAHGTAALNIDGCRSPLSGDDAAKYERGSEAWRDHAHRYGDGNKAAYVYGVYGVQDPTEAPAGRWPANVLLTHSPECKPDGCVDGCPCRDLDGVADPNAGASRYFVTTSYAHDDTGMPVAMYVPKAMTGEREAGIEASTVDRNFHPTVKPAALMRWLIRLVVPPGATVLDPFAGSGTTLVAAVLEGVNVVGCELTADYLPIIDARVAWAQALAGAVTGHGD